MKTTVNGIEREVTAATVDELLAQLDVARDGVAVALNDRVVRRADYATARLLDGDSVEIVRAVAGG